MGSVAFVILAGWWAVFKSAAEECLLAKAFNWSNFPRWEIQKAIGVIL